MQIYKQKITDINNNYLIFSLVIFSLESIFLFSFVTISQALLSILVSIVGVVLFFILVKNLASDTVDWANIFYAIIAVFVINYFFKAIWIVSCPPSLLSLHYNYALDSKILNAALLYIIGGMLLFISGYSWKFSSLLAYKIPLFKKWYSKKLYYKSVVLYTFSMCIVLIGALTLNQFFRVAEQTILENPFQNYIVNFYRYSWAGLIIIIYDNIKRPRRYKKISIAIMLSISFCIAMFSGIRENILMLFLLVVFVYKYTGEFKRIKKYVIFMLICFCFAYLLMLDFRNSYLGSHTGDFNMNEMISSMVDASENIFNKKLVRENMYPVNNLFVQKMMQRQSTLENFCTIISLTPDPYNYQLGRDWIFLIPNAFIPRAFWKSKPDPEGPFIFNVKYLKKKDQKSYASPSLMGDLYMNFGVVGMLLGMFIAGIIFRCYYVYFIIRTNASLQGIVYYIILFLPMFFWVESYVFNISSFLKILVYLYPLHLFMRIGK